MVEGNPPGGVVHGNLMGLNASGAMFCPVGSAIGSCALSEALLICVGTLFDEVRFSLLGRELDRTLFCSWLAARVGTPDRTSGVVLEDALLN